MSEYIQQNDTEGSGIDLDFRPSTYPDLAAYFHEIAREWINEHGSDESE